MIILLPQALPHHPVAPVVQAAAARPVIDFLLGEANVPNWFWI